MARWKGPRSWRNGAGWDGDTDEDDGGSDRYVIHNTKIDFPDVKEKRIPYWLECLIAAMLAFVVQIASTMTCQAMAGWISKITGV